MKTSIKILISCLVLFTISCEKARTCNCDITQTINTTINYNNGLSSTYSITTNSYTDIKSNNHMTKNAAYETFDCYNRNEKYTDMNSTYSGKLTTTTTNDYSDEYKCVLK